MIIKANPRGSGRELANHLLNGHDNECVEVHAINGFVAEDIPGAFREIEAISRGTRCRQYLFSVSLSPPEDARVSTQVFEDAIARVAENMGLQNQPHVIVFHEKNARRHCHAVFSRIDTETMKAINLPFFKNRLTELSKTLYLENDWPLPPGFIDREKRHPLNYSLQEWQQARRSNDDPRLLKQVFKTCWTQADSRLAFESALKQYGYALAQGDRRGFVAVDWRGEVYALSRWCDVKTKALKQRLGEANSLPSVAHAQKTQDQALVRRMLALQQDIREKYSARFSALETRKIELKTQHQQQRAALETQQAQRQAQEHAMRHRRFSKGVRGLWHRVTGRHANIQRQNEQEAYQCAVRDRQEKDALIFRQIEARREWMGAYRTVHRQYHQQVLAFRQAVFSQLPEQTIERLKQEMDSSGRRRNREMRLEP